MADKDAENEHACALCGGELTDHELTDEREQEIRNNIPNIDEEDADVHARVCTECGHVSFYTA